MFPPKFVEANASLLGRRILILVLQVLDFGAARDGVPEEKRGRRIVVDLHGREAPDGNDTMDEGSHNHFHPKCRLWCIFADLQRIAGDDFE